MLIIIGLDVCCGYSLEAPPRGASIEYRQHMFSWRNEKNINTIGLKKYLIKSYELMEFWHFFTTTYLVGTCYNSLAYSSENHRICFGAKIRKKISELL